MTVFGHEKAHLSVNTSRRKPRASCGLCSESPGSLYRYKDSGSVADIGGSASGMGCQGFRSDASKLESMDAQDERARPEVPKAEGEARASGSFDPGDSPSAGGPVREVSLRT